MHKNTNPKILVVNDDSASLLALVSVLSVWGEENGCDLITARSGPEALRQVLLHDFAVILLDVKMPGMDGFETAEAIHSRLQSSAIPIIFVTAFLSDDINRLKAYQQGAVDYLFTPVVPQMLLAKVSVFVALAKKNLELADQAAKLMAINHRLEVEMNERKIADQKNREKDQFLAMLGHELRNPLSAIVSASGVMDLPNVNADSMLRARQIIRRQSKHLSHIVDDLLDMARVMEGKIILSKKIIDLSATLESCLETLKVTGRSDNHTINIHSASTWVEADSTRLEQILTNLIDNALKYTNAGGTVDVKLKLEDGMAVFTISDSGVGIDTELLPRVFDVFVQGQDTLNRARGGLGIGLAMVRQLVMLHGGSVSAHSDGIGQGSRFTLKLPAIANPADMRAGSGTGTNSQPKTYSILLIEDNEDCRITMADLLRSYGHRVSCAADGASGIDMAVVEKTDIALVDIGLPGMDGYAVATRLRALPATSKLRLIALTGYGQETDQQRAIDAGFDLHLLKPVEAEALLKALQMPTQLSAIV